MRSFLGHRQLLQFWLMIAALCLLQAGCGGSSRAPIDSRSIESSRTASVSKARRHQGPRPAKYTVRHGDTLYAIAFQYGLDYRQLARWNGIRAPYIIYPGRQLRLRAGPKKQTVRAPSGNHSKSSRTSAGSADKQKSRPVATRISWRWPATGSVRKVNSKSGKLGIEILGKQGQAVLASAAGRVVYVGSGLLGYGKLIIIKHNDVYLSAYAHNQDILVKEGHQIAAGQQVARMGATGTDRVKLHFEIRRDGEPVPPLSLLPSR